MGLKKKKVNAQTGLIIGEKQRFIFNEAYKALRTNILFSLPGEGCKKIFVTSAFAGEGKTTVATHLAVSFAEMGVNVLIIDCDMRRGKVHRYLDIKGNVGLANVLAGFSDLSSAIQKTSVENLYAISAGSVPPNPAELLASGRMEALVQELSKSFDYIIFDTVPVNVVSDALPLVKLVDGCVIVVRQNYSDKTAVSRCASSLEFADAKILGVVFNDVQTKKTHKDRRYGYYKRGYDYGYGYGYGYYPYSHNGGRDNADFMKNKTPTEKKQK